MSFPSIPAISDPDSKNVYKCEVNYNTPDSCVVWCSVLKGDVVRCKVVKCKEV